MEVEFAVNENESGTPSQAHFGNRQILLFKTCTTTSGKRQQFQRIKFNAQYASKKWLCEKISEETFQLCQDFRESQYTHQECLVYYLNRILKHIVKNADEDGLNLEHKILYLTFKFLLHLICKRAISKNIQPQHYVSLHQWLIDVDALFFKSNTQNFSTKEENTEDGMLESLKKKDYESVLSCLQILGAKQTDTAKKKRIQLTTKLLIMKYGNMENQLASATKSEEMKQASRATLQTFQKQCQQVFRQEKAKKKNHKMQAKDKIELVGQVLLGNYEHIRSLVKGSWPLFLSHIFQSDRSQSYEDFKEQAKTFLNLQNKNYVAVSPQTEFLLNLLSGKSLHIIYQSLFDLVSPFYSHLLAYYFYYFYEATPLLVLMQEDYMTDLVRNLLEQASQVSYICLFLIYGVIQSNDRIERKAEMFEPLLYYHLSVIDLDGSKEITQFLNKIRFLGTLSLEKYGLAHFEILFSRLCQSYLLNETIIESYLLLFTLYRYNFDIVWYIDQCFVRHSLSQQTICKIEEIVKKLQIPKKGRKYLRQLEKIMPSFKKFIMLDQAKYDENLENRMRIAIDLMRTTVQSFPLTKLLYDIIQIQQRTVDRSFHYEPDQLSLQHQFHISLRSYLDHYPRPNFLEEGELIQAINLLIS